MNNTKYYTLNNVFTNKLKVENIININNNNIININNINSSNLILNEYDNKHIIITDDTNMDINIILSNNTINIKYLILLTKNQNSLKISCKTDEKIIGNYSFYNNYYINNINNNQKKTQFIKSNDSNKIFYVPQLKYGLYSGSMIILQYLSNKTWNLEAKLIGQIPYQLNLYEINNELLIYISLDLNKIIYVISKNNNNNTYYFNKIYNNNINLFFKNKYSIIKLIDIKTNNILFINTQTSNNYNIQVKINDNFINLTNDLDFINNNFSNITDLFNTNTNEYNNINTYQFNNYIEYKIINNNNNNIIINEKYFNIIDINAYYKNDIINNIELNTLLFDMYNAFVLNNNLINTLNI